MISIDLPETTQSTLEIRDKIQSKTNSVWEKSEIIFFSTNFFLIKSFFLTKIIFLTKFSSNNFFYKAFFFDNFFSKKFVSHYILQFYFVCIHFIYFSTCDQRLPVVNDLSCETGLAGPTTERSFKTGGPWAQGSHMTGSTVLLHHVTGVTAHIIIRLY